MQMGRRNINEALTGRALLWLAWLCPAALTVVHATNLTDGIARAAVSAGLAGLVAFLPGRCWQIACAASLAALPFTLWWCGAAATGGTGPGYDGMLAVANTNWNEALGAAKYLATNLAFIGIVIVHGLLLLLACRLALRQRQMPDPPAVQVALLAAVLPLALVALLAAMQPHQPTQSFNPLFGAATVATPLGSAENIIEDYVAIKIHSLGVKRDPPYVREAARGVAPLSQPMLAIFMLGESVRAAAYGRNQRAVGPASQQLALRIAAGLGSWLPTVCAASNGTLFSVPMLLTATPPEYREQSRRSPTILGILKAAGFATAWIANNHGGSNALERGHDFYGGNFIADPDRFNGKGTGIWKYDEQMLPMVRDFAARSTGPRAMLLHLFGSHFAYEARYPAADFAAEPAGLSRDELEDLRYQRSLEHTAGMILQIASLLDQTAAPAFAVYTGDHGENLPSDHNGLLLHMGPRTSQKDAMTTALVIWNQAMADTGRPALMLPKLLRAPEITHVDVANLYLALAGARDGPVEPTANPTTWAKVAVGDDYRVVPCSAVQP
jgi:glucan phosphoethanolaminetransferase (alkaline phosphatase superfamily)